MTGFDWLGVAFFVFIGLLAAGSLISRLLGKDYYRGRWAL